MKYILRFIKCNKKIILKYVRKVFNTAMFVGYIWLTFYALWYHDNPSTLILPSVILVIIDSIYSILKSMEYLNNKSDREESSYGHRSRRISTHKQRRGL